MPRLAAVLLLLALLAVGAPACGEADDLRERGLWGNSVYREGKLEPGDVEEAISTVLAAGDFDTSTRSTTARRTSGARRG